MAGDPLDETLADADARRLPSSDVNSPERQSGSEANGEGVRPSREERLRLRAMAQERLRAREDRLKARAEREAKQTTAPDQAKAKVQAVQARIAAQVAEKIRSQAKPGIEARQARIGAQVAAKLRADEDAKLRDRQKRIGARAAEKIHADEEARANARRARIGAQVAAKIASSMSAPPEPRRVFIHIGLRKSGSASIQSFLSANEEALRAAGFDYPKAGRGENRKAHHKIAHDLRATTKKADTEGALESLHRHWREGGSREIILSSEMFEGAKRSECKRLAQLLGGPGVDFRILMILRDLVDLTPSSYAQKVKFGQNTYNFDEFFDHRMGKQRVDYHATARKWCDAFGWHSLCVRVLDPRSLKNGDLIEDFLAVAGVPPSVELRRPGQVNVAPGWRVLEAMRALYEERHGLPAIHPLAGAQDHSPETRKRVGLAAAEAGEGLGWNRDRGRYMTLQQAQRCHDRYRAAVATFNEQLIDKIPEPLSLEERGFVPRERAPDASQIPADELRDFYDAVGHSFRPRGSSKARKAKGASKPKLGLSAISVPETMDPRPSP